MASAMLPGRVPPLTGHRSLFVALLSGIILDFSQSWLLAEPRFWFTSAIATLLLLHRGWKVLGPVCLAAVVSATSLWMEPATPFSPRSLLLIIGMGMLVMPLAGISLRLTLELMRKRRSSRYRLSNIAMVVGASIGAITASALWQHILQPAAGIAHSHDLLALGFRVLALGFPALLAAAISEQWRRRRGWLTPALIREISPWIAGALVACLAIHHYDGKAVFLILPLILWSSIRLSAFPATLLNGAIAVVVLFMIPAGAIAEDTHLMAQVAVFVIGGLFLSASIEDRRHIEAGLEDRVMQRTQDLQQINQELRDEVFIRKQAEKSLIASSRKYRSLIETAGSPILILDRQFRIRQWNRAAGNLFHQPQEEMLGKHFVNDFLPRSFQEETHWKIQKVFETGQTLENLEIEIVDDTGKSQVMLWNVARMSIEDEARDEQVVIIGQNITSIRETQNQLHFLAHYDVLTGAANRRLFEDRCRQALRQASRNGHDVGLIGLDVDHFKRINDTLGHDAGDTLLKELFARMQQCVRAEDTIGRLGGDEFAILLNKVNGAEGCAKVAENLLKTITQPIQLPGKQLVITTSIGVTLAPRDGSDYSALLKNADMAMYRAKKNGRNNIQFYEAEMGEEVAHQMDVEQALRRALNQNELLLHYQPQIDLEDDRVVGFEALLRWQHPEKGLLTPDYFLDIAEQSGLLPTLSSWIIRNVTEQAMSIQAMAGTPQQVCLNLSARELKQPNLASAIRDALSDSGLNPRLLNLEINEQSIVSHLEEATRALEQLKLLGVTITVDSFGSGLSSLSHLASLPVDALKVHHSLVKDVPNDNYDTAIFNTLVAISQGMELRLIVEGLETEEQEDYFRSKGVRYVQGHRFSPPIPKTEMPAFFARLDEESLRRNASQMGLSL